MPNPIANQIGRNRNTAEDNIIKGMRNLLKLENKKHNGIKDRVLRDIETLFESDNEDYYEPIRTGNAFVSNQIEYESIGNKDKTLSVEYYLDKIKP